MINDKKMIKKIATISTTFHNILLNHDYKNRNNVIPPYHRNIYKYNIREKI